MKVINGICIRVFLTLCKNIEILNLQKIVPLIYYNLPYLFADHALSTEYTVLRNHTFFVNSGTIIYIHTQNSITRKIVKLKFNSHIFQSFTPIFIFFFGLIITVQIISIKIKNFFIYIIQLVYIGTKGK